VGVQNTRPGRAPKIKEMTNWLEVAVLARFAGLKPSLLQLLSRVWRCNCVHSVLRQQHPKDFLAISLKRDINQVQARREKSPWDSCAQDYNL